MKLKTDNGEVILESEELNVKITTKRDIYLKRKEDKEFKTANAKVPLGLSVKEKAIFAFNLREQFIQKYMEEKEKKEE